MDVTHVNLTTMDDPNNDALLAFGSVVFDEEFAVHNLRLVETDSRVIVAMPNEKKRGEFRDIAHPINQQCREKVREAMIGEYNRLVAEKEQIPREPLD